MVEVVRTGKRTQNCTSRPHCWKCKTSFLITKVIEALDDKGDAVMTCSCGERTFIQKEFPPLSCFQVLKEGEIYKPEED